MQSETARDHLERIFRAGLNRADPYRMFEDHLQLEDNILKIQFEQETRVIDLARYQRIFVFGAGKATARMAQAVEDLLGERITGGMIAVKYGHTATLRRVQQIEAAHPVPDENSLRTAREIAALAAGFDEATLVINLISGGGSALFDGLLSYEENGQAVEITLADLQRTTQALLRCGADINEINCIRKHISTVKGGRLVRLLSPATTINFILSDVIGDRLDVIASGLTVADDSTFAQALQVLDKYSIADQIAPAVLRALQLGAAGKIPETPKAGDPAFEHSHNLLIGTLYHSLLAAGDEARSLGYHTLVLSSQLTGEARELAKFMMGLARDVQQHELAAPRPACLIAGGESTVTLRGSGKGGRNQEMALAFLCEMKTDPAVLAGVSFLSASTDGSDGPTDAAGAFASLALYRAALECGLNPEEYLRNNDSYTFFDQLGGLLKTGPTGTNVCDLQIVLVV
jgi:hydroxypyruvate reductase